MMRLYSRGYIILSPRNLTCFWIALFAKPELELFLVLVGWELVLPTVGETDVSTDGAGDNGGLTRSSSILNYSIDPFARILYLHSFCLGYHI